MADICTVHHDYGDEEERVLRPPRVVEIIDGVKRKSGHEIVHELWGAGYTITARRRGDPFEVPQELIPRGMSYQWANKADLDHLKTTHWHQVPASRHDGLFMPAGYLGDIEVGGMLLIEKLKAEVDEAHAANVAKAHKNVDDWVEKFGGQFSGGVRVWTGDPNNPTGTVRPVGNPDLARSVMQQGLSARISTPVLEPTLPVIVCNAATPLVAPLAPKGAPPQSWLRWLFNLISTEH